MSMFSSRKYLIFQIFLTGFSKNLKFSKPYFFASGEFHEYIVTERLRVLVHISNYIRTLEILEKKLSDNKNEPKHCLPPENRRQLLILHIYWTAAVYLCTHYIQVRIENRYRRYIHHICLNHNFLAESCIKCRYTRSSETHNNFLLEIPQIYIQAQQ